MANTLVKAKLLEGSKRAIFHFYMEADGSGEFQNEVLIDPQADFDIPPGGVMQLSIQKIWYGSAIYDFVLKFNALNPVPVWVASAEATNHVSFEYFGGLADQSAPEGDGKILISTNGFAALGSLGSLVIEVKKD